VVALRQGVLPDKRRTDGRIDSEPSSCVRGVYNRSGEARRKLAAVRKVIKYSELLAEGRLAPAKSADALYEMERLLYIGMILVVGYRHPLRIGTIARIR